MKSFDDISLIPTLGSEVKEEILEPEKRIVGSDAERALDFIHVFSISFGQRIVVVEFGAHGGVVDDLQGKLEISGILQSTRTNFRTLLNSS